MKTAIYIVLLALLTTGLAQDRPSSQDQPSSQDKNSSQEPVQGPTFRKNVNLVNLFFTVKDKHGALVPDLPRDQFEVLEDGKPQTIKYFSAESNLPLTLGIMIDSSGSMERMLPEEQVIAGDFLRQVLTDKDLAFVISFDVDVDLLQDLTSDVHLLRKGLQKAHVNVNFTAPSGRPGLGQGPISNPNPRGTVLYDAVYLGSNDILSRQVGRKAMILLTDGVDEGSRLKLRDALEAAQKADVICYVLLMYDPHYGSDMSDMSHLAEQTGGRAISVGRTDKLSKAFSDIANELRSQYSIGYTPANEKHDGTFRKIEIKSKGEYKIQARKGYYAPTE